MKELSAKLISTVTAAEHELRNVSAAESIRPVLRGGWSRKQVLGHLIDSATNNHQRFVRAAIQGSLDFPGYDQDNWVKVQATQEADWELLIALWATYNRYLAGVIEHLPTSSLKAVCRIGSYEPATLEWLANDYLTHMLHHLKEIGVDAGEALKE